LKLFFCSFFARPKNEPKKGAENDNRRMFGRLLHIAVLALPNMQRFAPFSVRLRTSPYNKSQFSITDKTVYLFTRGKKKIWWHFDRRTRHILSPEFFLPFGRGFKNSKPSPPLSWERGIAFGELIPINRDSV
jgi:hypothetical protein